METDRQLYIDIHALQVIPPNNMNRDDTGSPKTARYGGVVRHRVSSQAWKRAIRDEFDSLYPHMVRGLRTRRLVPIITDRVRELLPEVPEKTIASQAEKVVKALKAKGTGKVFEKDRESGECRTKMLYYLSEDEVKELVDLTREAVNSEERVTQKSVQEALAHAQMAVDVALFGRMVTDSPKLSVDAAVQVAHAIGVGRAETEFDYFTAVDDALPEGQSGAAMIETTEFLSSTLYRYANVDVNHLHENLGSVEATSRAIEAFLKSFIVSMPTGKQNSFANRTLPSAVVVQLRHTQPVSLVNAFEMPIGFRDDEGTIEQACKRLVAQERSIDNAFGVEPAKTYVIEADAQASCLDVLATEGSAMPMKTVVSSLGGDVSAWLSRQTAGDK